MRFLAKYELLQPVTSGAVETFVARDVDSDQRVLIHMFNGLDAFAALPASEWAVKSYRGVGPPILGELVEAGRYPQTSQAYLICKLSADPAALQEWVLRYRVHCGETRDSSHLTPESSPAPLFGGADTAPLGELTKAFLGSSTADVDAQGRIVSQTGGDPALRQRSGASNWSRHPLGAFSKEFLSGFDEGVEILPAPAPSNTPLPADSSRTGNFTAEFRLATTENQPIMPADAKPPRPQPPNPLPLSKADAEPYNFAASPSSPISEISPRPVQQPFENPVPLAKTGTGEFSKFFRGPFGSPAPAEASGPEPVTPVPRREEKGEFTSLFGSGRQEIPLGNGALSPLVEPAQPQEPGSFTELFRVQQPMAAKPEPLAAPSLSAEPAPISDAGIPWRLTAATPLPASVASSSPAPPAPPPQSVVAPEVGATFSGRMPRGAGATQAFVPMGGRAPAEPLVTPAGPSEYTQFVTPKPPPPEPVAVHPAAVAPGAVQMPAAPPLPPAPMPAQVVAPPAPQAQLPQAPAPQIQLPQVQLAPPQLQLPPAPAPAPQPTPAGPAQVSYVPLIIAMNVLLLAAVALVLYFALHR